MHRILWVLVLLVAACNGTDEGVVARVGRHTITVQDYDRMAAKLLEGPFRDLEVLDDDSRRQMLDAMVDRELVLLEARRRGLDQNPEITSQLRWLEEGLLLRTLYNREAVGEIEFTDTDLELYFYQNDFDQEIRVSSLACASEEDAAAILAELKRGVPFAEIAGGRPEQPPGSQGAGDLGFMPPADLLPEVRSQLLSLEPGQYYPEPLPTRYGLQVMMVTDRRTVSLEDRRDRMADRLRHEMRARRIAAYQDSMAAAHGLECTPGAAPEEEEPQCVLCTWDDGQMTGAEYAEAVELYGEATSADSAAHMASVRRMALRELLLGEARRLGYLDETVRARLARKRAQLLGDMLYAEVAGDIEVDGSEARSYFEANPEKYGPQPLVTVQEILVADESLAQELRRRIEAGDDMTALSDEHNIRKQTRGRGGRMRLWRRENSFLGPLAPAALDAKVGTLHGPMKVPGGFSVFRVTDRGELPARTFPQVERSITARLQSTARAAAMDTLLAELRRKYQDRIQIYPESLSDVLQGMTAPAEHNSGAADLTE